MEDLLERLRDGMGKMIALGAMPSLSLDASTDEFVMTLHCGIGVIEEVRSASLQDLLTDALLVAYDNAPERELES